VRQHFPGGFLLPQESDEESKRPFRDSLGGSVDMLEE
jgi:hypothetical protein